MAGRNRKAVDATIRALRDLGRVEPVDEALLVAARALADVVDVTPDDAALWRQYRQAVSDLRGIGGDSSSGLDDLLAELDSAAEVGNPPAT